MLEDDSFEARAAWLHGWLPPDLVESQMPVVAFVRSPEAVERLAARFRAWGIRAEVRRASSTRILQRRGRVVVA